MSHKQISKLFQKLSYEMFTNESIVVLALTPLHSKRPKLVAVLSAVGLRMSNELYLV